MYDDPEVPQPLPTPQSGGQQNLHFGCEGIGIKQDNMHLAKGCKDPQILHIREGALQQIDVAMLEWKGNDIAEWVSSRAASCSSSASG